MGCGVAAGGGPQVHERGPRGSGWLAVWVSTQLRTARDREVQGGLEHLSGLLELEVELLECELNAVGEV